MNKPSTYAVYTKDNDAPKIKMVVFKGPKEALDFLKTLRSDHYDGGSFIVPNTASERDAFPYRNKIGPLRADDSNHWGYHFQVPNTANVYTLWMEKQEVGPDYRTLKEDLGDRAVAEWVKLCKCDYVVHSNAQGNLDQVHGRRYDEVKEEFVFDEELEEEARKQETAAREDGEKVDQATGQLKDVGLI
jgi:hypothetical protein